MERQDEILNDTSSRDLLRREGIRFRSELNHTPKRRSTAVPSTGQDRLLQERSTPSRREACQPAVDSRRRNSLRDTNDDREGREWTGRYHSRRTAPSTGTRVRATQQTPTEAGLLEQGVSPAMEAVTDKRLNYISQTWNNAKEQKKPMNADDSSGRHQHYHQDSNAWYERQVAEPWTVLVPRSVEHHGGLQPREDPWMVQDMTGNDHRDYRNDGWEQTHVKELHGGNTAHGNGSTVHRHRMPRE